MKKILYVLLSVILISGIIIIFFINKKTTEEQQAIATINENKIVDITANQQNELKEEKKYYREHKKQIEYVNIKPEEVQIPILMYHSISDTDPNNTLLVPPAMFEEQMKWLSDNGFTAMLLDDVIKAMKSGEVPKKPVAITFDDGYADNYTSAYPILKKYDMKATFFVITNNVDKDGYYMSSDMLKEMKVEGMAISNHTSDHRELNKLSKDEQINSIQGGNDFLLNKLGVHNKYLCYPVGRYSDATIEVEKSLGLEAAVTTNPGIANAADGFYSLDRVRISPMSLESFKKIFMDFLNK